MNRDPAAITSLSVACRYASRPPSDPTNPLPFKSLAPSRALSLFGRFSLFATFPKLFRAFALSPRGYKMSTRHGLSVTYGQQSGVHARVISTKIVTEGVTISVVRARAGRRFDAKPDSNRGKFSHTFYDSTRRFTRALRRSNDEQNLVGGDSGEGALLNSAPWKRLSHSTREKARGGAAQDA